MPMESDIPGGERGSGGADFGGRRGEGDAFAQRRAQRAGETPPDPATARRVEAAEATVHTLERHVASLQQRLAEAEEDRRRLADLLEAERTVGVEREGELRRVKQREYAEQQLRVEAEERLGGLDRESRAEIGEVARRLAVSEREVVELGQRVEGLQRQLTEGAGAPAGAASGIDGEAHVRLRALEAAVAELERGSAAEHGGELRRVEALEAAVAELDRGLRAERGARERLEALMEAIRDGHRRIEGLVAQLKDVVARLVSSLSSVRAAQAPQRSQPPVPASARVAVAEPVSAATVERVAQERGAEMAAALAAAVERLRERAQVAAAGEGEPEEPVVGEGRAPMPPPAAPRASAPEHAEVAAEPSQDRPARPSHKHSRSLIGRIRNRRKERRAR